VVKKDAFTMLIKANEDESGKLQLDDQELVRVFLSTVLLGPSDVNAK
jgi:hypothetical protein